MTKPWDRVQSVAEAERLLANYRRTAVDGYGDPLFCKHGEHRKAPCSQCRDEEVNTIMTPEDPPVPEPEPDEPTDA